MKTLIINGSPRSAGDTAYLIEVLKENLEGEVVELSAFRDDISPCMDCRACLTTGRCAIDDEMRVIYDDDYDSVVLAAPVYFATLPGQVLSLMSRFQAIRAAKILADKRYVMRRKKAGLILVAGGKGNERHAEHHIHVFFRMLGGYGYEEHFSKSLHTDELPASRDDAAIGQVKALAEWLQAE